MSYKNILFVTNFVILSFVFIISMTFVFGEQSDNITINMDQAAHNLAKSLTFKTISFENLSKINYSEFKNMQDYIEKTYPLINSKLEQIVINNSTLIYKWPGNNSSAKAIVILAHQDVVPAEQPEKWTHPPFAGIIENDTIFGRGAYDDKMGVFGNLEAFEYLLKQGFQPRHSIYLVLGHDEEIGGFNGVKAVVDYMKNKDIKIELVMDEGGFVSVKSIKGIDTSIGLLGVGEKGYLDFKLKVVVQPGHSSMPLLDNAIQVIAGAIKTLQDNPMPPVFDDWTMNSLKEYSPYANHEFKDILENPLKNQSLTEEILSKEPMFNALIRTVMSPTIIEGGVKSNIIPAESSVTYNVRIHTGDSIEKVLDHVKKVTNDPRIEIESVDFSAANPSPSPVLHPSFKIIEKLTKEVFGENVPIIPFVGFGGTDTKHFQNIGYGEAFYRWNPVNITSDIIKGMHGYDEKLPIGSYKNFIKFMIMFIKETNNF